MPPLTTQSIVFLIGVGLFTLATAWSDLRLWKVPNKLTLPMFVLGFVYQGLFRGVPGLLDGTYGFLVGFGVFFVFWLIGVAGGGDVKLIGALSVWLGYRMLLPVLGITTALVAVIHITYLAWNFMTKGRAALKKQLIDTKAPKPAGQKDAPRDPQAEILTKRVQGKVIMGYAVPVAMATWGVVLWSLFRP